MKLFSLVRYLLIAESHLPSRIPTDIHAAQEHALLPFHQRCWRGRVAVMAQVVMMVVLVVVVVLVQLSLWNAPAQLRLDRVVVLFIYYIVHGVTVDEQILLRKIKKIVAGLPGHNSRSVSPFLYVFPSSPVIIDYDQWTDDGAIIIITINIIISLQVFR